MEVFHLHETLNPFAGTTRFGSPVRLSIAVLLQSGRQSSQDSGPDEEPVA